MPDYPCRYLLSVWDGMVGQIAKNVIHVYRICSENWANWVHSICKREVRPPPVRIRRTTNEPIPIHSCPQHTVVCTKTRTPLRHWGQGVLKYTAVYLFEFASTAMSNVLLLLSMVRIELFRHFSRMSSCFRGWSVYASLKWNGFSSIDVKSRTSASNLFFSFFRFILSGGISLTDSTNSSKRTSELVLNLHAFMVDGKLTEVNKLAQQFMKWASPHVVYCVGLQLAIFILYRMG